MQLEIVKERKSCKSVRADLRLRRAVENMLDEAARIARGEAEYGTMEDAFGELNHVIK